MVRPIEEFAARLLIWLTPNQSKGMMPEKFVHLFVDMSQITSQKIYKQLIINK
jgi:hypothetical protein